MIQLPPLNLLLFRCYMPTTRLAFPPFVAYVLSSTPHRERKDIAYNQDGIETIVFEVAMKRE